MLGRFTDADYFRGDTKKKFMRTQQGWPKTSTHRVVSSAVEKKYRSRHVRSLPRMLSKTYHYRHTRIGGSQINADHIANVRRFPSYSTRSGSWRQILLRW
jgi:hypothetical protein